ncbi:Nitrogen assimilation transcription factor nit-4 [Lasiodiplodia theobromae]|uniref:Nitrogen assimilation transcription factor nit-4 n=1 Tax=Lasiodiplodia theobromae TaxID=45133 RepID=A0A5N5CUM9_9PEZI|nr:Nitrogen assimilation transcription factor nit-4 [Lasiodiplodia theobromae]
MPPHSTPPLLQPKQRSTSPAEPSRGPAELGAPDLALNRRNAPQNKRKSVVAVACRPCQRRKHKCDGQRPTCTRCLTGNRTDCTYDADGDQRRTTALKSRIQSLSRQVDDLKDIVRGIAAAVDHDQAHATARQLADQAFLNTSEIAEAFRNATVHTSAISDTSSAVLDNEMLDPRMLSDCGASSTATLPSHSAVETPGGNVNSGTTGEPSLSPWASFSQTDALAPIRADSDENSILDLSSAAWPSIEQTSQLQPVFDISCAAWHGNDQSVGDMSPDDPLLLYGDPDDAANFHTIRKCDGEY